MELESCGVASELPDIRENMINNINLKRKENAEISAKILKLESIEDDTIEAPNEEPNEELSQKPIEDYDESECSICLEEMSIGNISQLNCRERGAPDNHWFHEVCITEWLDNYCAVNSRSRRIPQKCPICRTGNKILITVNDETGNEPLCGILYRDAGLNNNLIMSHNNGHTSQYEDELTNQLEEDIIIANRNVSLYEEVLQREEFVRRQLVNQEGERTRHRRLRRISSNGNNGCSIL